MTERTPKQAEHPYYNMRVTEDGRLFARRMNRKTGAPVRSDIYDELRPFLWRGQPFVSINMRRIPVAMLVMEAFTGQYVSPSHIRYLDGDRSNVRLSNLAAERPLAPHRRGRPEKLTPEMILEAHEKWCAGESIRHLAKLYRVSETTLRARFAEIPE